MATQVQRRRGTTAEHATFTGALAETTIDTTKKTVVVHDGSTAGGVPLATEASVTAHLSDTTDAHDASAISVLDTGGYFTATDVEGVLAELGSSSALTYFTEARSTAAPNATVPAHSLLASGAEADIDSVLAGKGTGALLSTIPDSLSAGGDKRGARAVDFQRVRSAATQVASGSHSGILAGYNNTSSGIVTVVSGGRGNTASGSYSCVSGGDANTASGITSVVSGGVSNTASGTNSYIPGGTFATTRSLEGRGSVASGVFSALGDAQVGKQVLRKTTTDATPIVVTADSGAASTTNVSVLPNNYSYTVSALVTARNTATGDTATWKVEGGIKRGANAAATALVGTPTVTSLGADAGMATTTVALIADTTLGAAEIQVTGIAATTIHWVCKFDTVECG